MDNDKTNNELVREIAQIVLGMDEANPEWFLEEAMRIQKLSLNLELARHHAERSKEVPGRKRSTKYDTRSLSKISKEDSTPKQSEDAEPAAGKASAAQHSDSEEAAADDAMNKASVTKPAEDSTTDLVHHLALEVRTIGSKLDDLVGFFPAAVKMMQSKVEAVERENEELKKSLVRAEENYESLEKQVKEMSALIKAQKKA